MVIDKSPRQPAPRPDACHPSTALFLEADRLNAQAYAMLCEPVSAQSIQEFCAAKQRADEMYRRARQAWAYDQDETRQ
ncbi:hypothetical protein GIW70_23220 [Pseudomonas syringae]|nr:hypothetical protein [Pseudomonas syringae]MCF5071090.1 hypothetical protein [Pseudomonas syringae]